MKPVLIAVMIATTLKAALQAVALPTDTLSVIDMAITLGVPLLVGYLASKYLEGLEWFQQLNSKNAVVIALSALLGFLLNLLKNWLIANPDVLAQVDPVVKMFLSSLALYLATQFAHGRAKAERVRLNVIRQLHR